MVGQFLGICIYLESLWKTALTQVSPGQKWIAYWIKDPHEWKVPIKIVFLKYNNVDRLSLAAV